MPKKVLLKGIKTIRKKVPLLPTPSTFFSSWFDMQFYFIWLHPTLVWLLDILQFISFSIYCRFYHVNTSIKCVQFLNLLSQNISKDMKHKHSEILLKVKYSQSTSSNEYPTYHQKNLYDVSEEFRHIIWLTHLQKPSCSNATLRTNLLQNTNSKCYTFMNYGARNCFAYVTHLCNFHGNWWCMSFHLTQNWIISTYI